MDLDHIVTCCIGPSCRLAELLHDVVDFRLGKLLGRGIALARRQFRRPDDLPALPACPLRPELARLVEGARRRALAARMGDLGGRQRAFLLEEARQPTVAFDLAVVPQAEVALGHPSTRLDGAVLGEDDTEATQGELAEMDEVVVGHLPVEGAILHHGRDDGAIGRGDAPQLEGREEQRSLQRSFSPMG